MPYSKSRLDKALRIIRAAKDQIKCQRASALHHPSQHKIRYRARRGRPLPFHPNSESSGEGDDVYEPGVRRRRKRIEPVKAPRAKRKAEDAAGGDNKRSKGRPRDVAERDSKDAYITVVLTSGKGKELLQALGKRFGTDVARALQSGSSSTLADRSLDPMQRDLESRYKAQTYMDALDLESALIENKDCRILRNGRQVPDANHDVRFLPCEACLEGDAMCRGPLNGVCARCSKQSLACVPYEEIGDVAQDEPSRTPRTSNDYKSHTVDSGLLTPPPTASRTGSMRSQLSGPTILISDSPAQSTMRSSSSLALRQGSIHEPETIVLDDEPQDSASGEIFTIETPFAHPINFRYLPAVHDLPCDFCSSCLFRLEGLGQRIQVEVLSLPDEKGYQELGAGHRAAGNEPTRMCVRCALERLYVMNCERHTFHKVPEFEMKAADYGNYSKQMQSLHRGPNIQHLKYKMCSLCPLPATFGCCTKQAKGWTGNALDPNKEVVGCGLVVCGSCKMHVEASSGLLNRACLRRHRKATQGRGEAVFERADAEFLYPGSLLKKAYGKCGTLRVSLRAD